VVILNKLDRLNRFYKVVDRGELGDSEVIEHFKELNMIIPAPWSSDKYIVYIGKGKPEWAKLRRSLKVDTRIRKPNCDAYSYPDTTTLDKVGKDKLMKTNLREVKRIGKHLEHLTGLPITRNTIMVAGEKNRRFCKSGISGYHIAHYHNTEPARICFRPMFLINPVYPTQQKCRNCNKRHIRYMLTLDRKWFKLSPTPEISRRVTKILALIDCTCHELAHHMTKGHGVEFQKKYILLFSTMLNDIISGKYYIERIN